MAEVAEEAEWAAQLGRSDGVVGVQVPIQVKLMDLGLLNSSERKWVDVYHSKCRQRLLPLLSGYEKEWLLRATEPLPTGT